MVFFKITQRPFFCLSYYDNFRTFVTINHYPHHPKHVNVSGLHQQQPISDGQVRVEPLVGILQVLRELGADPIEVMTSVGLHPDLFDDSENTMLFATAGRLLKGCAARTQCPHFGLLVGQRAGPASLGLAGHLLLHSPDVGSALRALILHLHLQDQGAVPGLSVEQDLAVLSYAIYQPGVEGIDQIYDIAMAIAFNILRALCGPIWLPTEVLFSHHRPEDVGAYRRCFQAPVRFDMEQTALVFPATWLDYSVKGADPVLLRQLEQRIAAFEQLNHHDLVGPLRRALRTLLIARQCSLEQVAQLFSMHRRTLNRRLEVRGITFRGLVDEVRYEIARQLLENTGMPVVQIAATLDYSDASAFTRAFRRWSGTTPTAWRARLDRRD